MTTSIVTEEGLNSKAKECLAAAISKPKRALFPSRGTSCTSIAISPALLILTNVTDSDYSVVIKGIEQYFSNGLKKGTKTNRQRLLLNKKRTKIQSNQMMMRIMELERLKRSTSPETHDYLQ
jgi:hypothetical protein